MGIYLEESSRHTRSSVLGKQKLCKILKTQHSKLQLMLGNIGIISLGLRSSFTIKNQGCSGWVWKIGTLGSFTRSHKVEISETQ